VICRRFVTVASAIVHARVDARDCREYQRFDVNGTTEIDRSGCYNPAVLSEILRRDASAGDDAAAASDRDAKIEQLLLVGLDHYFAAQYEQAINVWTRALFFDRNHARARAYIERARSALAERQRRSEELQHDGISAFHRGDGEAARRLLRTAMESGAPTDEALAVLERLERAESQDASGLPDTSTATRRRSGAGLDDAADSSESRVGVALLVVSVLAALVLGGYIVSAARPDWQLLLPFLSLADPPPGSTSAPVAQDLSLPLPRRGEMALEKGRSLAAAGRLHEALAALEQVRPTDPQRNEADELRAEIQRQLLALTRMPPPPSSVQERRLP
jgi:tetratricopeptide (TPR) repeat protein